MLDEQEVVAHFPLSPGLHTELESTDLVFWGCRPTPAPVCIPALQDPLSYSWPLPGAALGVLLSLFPHCLVSSLLISNFLPT